MPLITFYRQARRDGSVRTGIELDKEALLGRFEGESTDFDPVLTWFVDIECAGDHLPDQPDAIRQWLLDQARVIQGGLDAVAADAEAGLDFQNGVLRRKLPGAPNGVTITLICTANRRPEAQQMAEVLRDIAGQWVRRIQDLPAIQPITL